MDRKAHQVLKKAPASPGVYLMRDSRGHLLYAGKAGNLKRRVGSYFQRPHEFRVEKLLRNVETIDYEKTGTAIEALILEAEYIKKYQPPYNVRDKDDKSFLYVEVTREKFPRVLLTRGKEKLERPSAGRRSSIWFGPFTSASHIREALKIVRKIFPFSVHPSTGFAGLTPGSLRASTPSVPRTQSRGSRRPERSRRACFEYEIGLCPGTCIGAISREDYLHNIKNVKLFFSGKKERILGSLQKEMNKFAKELEFEKAAEMRRQIFALKHIQDVAFLGEESPVFRGEIRKRIEGYDVSNISGTSAVGSMVVFRDDYPDKNEYRKFKIRTITGSNDIGMLKEVLRRRFSNPWPLPNLILIDGGKGQVHAAEQVLEEFGLKIPVVGIAKGPKRKRNDLIGKIPEGINSETLIKVRDEAHRFARSYHIELRDKQFKLK